MDIAKQEGADAVAHGCTGKGNDQVITPSEALQIKLEPLSFGEVNALLLAGPF